jgi:hypothetical protein
MAYVTLDKVTNVCGATQNAVRVRFDNMEEKWIPRSLCEDGDQLDMGDRDVVVQQWFADKEGLPYV